MIRAVISRETKRTLLEEREELKRQRQLLAIRMRDITLELHRRRGIVPGADCTEGHRLVPRRVMVINVTANAQQPEIARALVRTYRKDGSLTTTCRTVGADFLVPEAKP